MKQVVKVCDVYHCDGCNARLGTTTYYSDGSSEFLCDCHVNCFGFFVGRHSYEVERSKKKSVSVEIIEKFHG